MVATVLGSARVNPNTLPRLPTLEAAQAFVPGWQVFLVDEAPDSLLLRGLNGLALAVTGDTAGAEAEATWFEELDRPYIYGVDTYWRAVILAHLGRLDEAVILLRQSYTEGRGRDVMYYDPNLMPLWGHEQYEQFIAPRG